MYARCTKTCFIIYFLSICILFVSISIILCEISNIFAFYRQKKKLNFRIFSKYSFEAERHCKPAMKFKMKRNVEFHYTSDSVLSTFLVVPSRIKTQFGRQNFSTVNSVLVCKVKQSGHRKFLVDLEFFTANN